MPKNDFLQAAAAAPHQGQQQNLQDPPSPPWLQPPLGYKHGTGAAFAAANLNGANSRAAAAGRALLQGRNSQKNLANASSSGLLAELQRRVSQQSLLQNLQQQSSASNLLAAAVRSGSGNLAGGSNLSISQLARNASGEFGGCVSCDACVAFLANSC